MILGSGIMNPLFQSTCPRGARRTGDVFQMCRDDFNPRAHEGHDWQHIIVSLHRYVHNFNPRAHEGHDGYWKHAFRTGPISIHVPTRGTTEDELQEMINSYFNPRAHEGHDPVSLR